MLSDARSEVSACFIDVTSITPCTGKFIYNARTEPIRERIFHVKQVLNFKGRENKFDVNRFAKSIDKCAHPMLCYTREPADVRDLKVKFRRLLWLDTCYGSCVVTFYRLPWKCSGGLCYLKHARERVQSTEFRVLSHLMFSRFHKDIQKLFVTLRKNLYSFGKHLLPYIKGPRFTSSNFHTRSINHTNLK